MNEDTIFDPRAMRGIVWTALCLVAFLRYGWPVRSAMAVVFWMAAAIVGLVALLQTWHV